MKKCIIQDRHETMTCTRCPLCEVKLNPSWKEQMQELCRTTPKKVKQKLLDLMHDGKSLGEASKECKIETGCACEILFENINHLEYLSKEAN